MAKQINNFELLQEGKGVKGTSIGRGTFKRSTMSKAQKRNHKRYRGQG